MINGGRNINNGGGREGGRERGRGRGGGRSGGRGGRGQGQGQGLTNRDNDLELQTIYNTGYKDRAKDKDRARASKLSKKSGNQSGTAGTSTSVSNNTNDSKQGQGLIGILLNLWPEKHWKNAFPSRPNRSICKFFARTGECGLSNCMFDHPRKGKDGDDALVDAAAASGNQLLHDNYELAFAIIRAVQSFKNSSNAPNAFRSSKTNDPRYRDAFVAGLQELVCSSRDLLDSSTEWHSEDSVKCYGLESTFFHIVLPRAMDSMETFAMNIMRTPDMALAKEVESLYLVLRLEVMKREDKVLKEVRNCVPVVSTSNSVPGVSSVFDSKKYSNVSPTLALHRSIMTHCRTSVHEMRNAANPRDAVIEELNDILVPYFRKVTYRKICPNTPMIDMEKQFNFYIDMNAFGSSANTVGTSASDLDIAIDPYISVEDGSTFDAADIQRAILWMEKPDLVLSAALKALNLKSDDNDENNDNNSDDDSDDNSDNDDNVGNDNGSDCEEKRFILREFVSTARVPVLKLKHVASGVDIDLIEFKSNELAALNTQLLRDYASQDTRVRPLMYAVKRWAKERCVSDSRNGTLSTYCWMILVVFFLQTQSAVTKLDEFHDDDENIASVSPDNKSRRVARQKLCLQNLQGTSSEGEETYRKVQFLSLSEIYEQVPLVESIDPSEFETDMVRLLMNFFAFYATEGADSFGTFGSIASIRKAMSIPKRGIGPTRDADVKRIETYLKNKEAVDDEHGAAAELEQDLSFALDQLKISTANSSKKTNGEDFKYTQYSPAVKNEKYGKLVSDSATSWRMSVEDPFELEHDLGSVIRTQLGQAYILTELRRAMAILHKNLIVNDEKGNDNNTETNIFEVLCQPNPDPPELARLCFLCFSSEHYFSDCMRFICFNCSERGHFTKHCPQERKARNAKKKGPGTRKRR